MGAHISKLRMYTRTPAAVFKDVDKALESKTPAKRHPSTVEGYKELLANNPEVENQVVNKNENLHKMLETVKVDSTGIAPTQNLRAGKKTRKLNVRPEGKLSVNQTEELFINAKVSPEVWTSEKIAEGYKIPENVARNLLTYYSSFRIYKKVEDNKNQPMRFYQKDPEGQF